MRIPEHLPDRTFFFFSSRRQHTRCYSDWSSDVCSSDLHPVKVNGVYKVGDVTFKRGLIGYSDLYDWVNSIRKGDHTVLRTVHVQLQDEAHNGPVMTWTLLNARPIRYVVPALNAKTGTEVAIEELVLSVEDLTIE